MTSKDAAGQPKKWFETNLEKSNQLLLSAYKTLWGVLIFELITVLLVGHWVSERIAVVTMLAFVALDLLMLTCFLLVVCCLQRLLGSSCTMTTTAK